MAISYDFTLTNLVLAVTVRETAWESFSEDEAPQPKKATPPAAPSAGGSSKARKSAPKGQGNIMSFFAKKS